MRIIAMLPDARGRTRRGCITVASGRIARVAPHHGAAGRAGDLDSGDLDFGAHVALPGFIDLQLNGAFGHDITTDPSSMWPIAERLPGHGVTAFLPTIITSPRRQRRAGCEAVRRPPAGHTGAAALGLHIEGPVLSPDRAGAHPRTGLADDADGLADELADDADAVALVTLAPEAANADRAIARLVRAGIAVSLGHTAATADQTRRALGAGAGAFTHLFNAMGPLHHREVGAAGAALLHPDAWVSLIVDGHHLADDAVRLAWRLAGAGRICLVTDAMAGMGAPAGSYRIGGVPVRCDETARSLDNGSLAGSLLTMPEAARRLRRLTGASWHELAAVTSTNPAELLGDADRGRLAPGRRADIVIVDPQLHPVATFVAGVLAWRRPEAAAETATGARPAPTGAGTGPRAAARQRSTASADPAPVERPGGTTATRAATPTAVGTATPTAHAAIGVDIGGTTYKAAVFDGAALGPAHRGATGRERSAAEVLAEIRDTIDMLAGGAEIELRGAGIACAGIVDPSAGTVVRAVNLGWSDVDVVASLRGGHGLPIALGHDVYLAALAEWETGAGAAAESMLYVSVGTGVASRLFTRHGSDRGHAGLAGEMGFMPVGGGSRPLESLASGSAIAGTYRRETGRRLTAEQVVAAAASGDRVAARVWSEAMDALAQGIAAAVCLQDPETVVLGGGVSAAGQALLDGIDPRIAEQMEPLRDAPPTVLAAHGADSGIIGAALLGGLQA